MNNQISYEDFMTVINKERNYKELKESIRMMKCQEDKKIDKYRIILSYCLNCRKNTQSINPVNPRTSNGKTMILSKCAICGAKKSKFIKTQEAK